MFKNLSIKAKLYVLMSVSILALILVSGKSIYGDITDTCSCSALKDGVVELVERKTLKKTPLHVDEIKSKIEELLI